MSKLICLIIFISFILISQPSQALTKCYKDICVGQKVLIVEGIYKGNIGRIVDILPVSTPDEDEQEIRDFYSYYVSFSDGTTIELYRQALEEE